MKGTFTAIFLFFISQINATQLALSFKLDVSFSYNTSSCNDSTPQILSFDQFQSLLSTESDTVFIINFWATWCAPCVQELPYFEKLNAALKGKKAKVVLVSLDFKSQIQTKLLPFLKKNKLHSEVVVLLEKDPNSWIPKVYEGWSGSIPATLIFDKNKAEFYEESFDKYEDLRKVVTGFMRISN
jgi:thiol-disulfide isomerase/thioredoxin